VWEEPTSGQLGTHKTVPDRFSCAGFQVNDRKKIKGFPLRSGTDLDDQLAELLGLVDANLLSSELGKHQDNQGQFLVLAFRLKTVKKNLPPSLGSGPE